MAKLATISGILKKSYRGLKGKAGDKVSVNEKHPVYYTLIRDGLAPGKATPETKEEKKEAKAAKKLAAKKLAAEELAAEELAAEKLAAEELAAEKLAAEELAAEKLTAEGGEVKKRGSFFGK